MPPSAYRVIAWEPSIDSMSLSFIDSVVSQMKDIIELNLLFH